MEGWGTMFALLFPVAAVAFLIGGIVGDYAATRLMRNDAIRRGHARYNETTGDWEWK